MERSILQRLSMPLLAAVVLLTSTSCFDIIEKIVLKKDGSGVYSLDMDASEALKMIMSFGGAMDSTGEMGALLEERMDTTIFFGQQHDSITRNWQYPAITGKTSMSVLMDGPAEKMTMTISLPFQDVDDIDKFSEDFQRSGDLGMADMLGGGEGGDNGALPILSGDQFSFKPGRLTRTALDPTSMFGDMDEEDMGVMSMFLMSADYTVIYELPSKVKSVEGEDIELQDKGRTVVMKRNFGDLLMGNSNLAIEVKYK